MQFSKHILFTLLFINTLLKTHSQNFQINYKYTQSEGLSSYNITKILQDDKGFIWLGTQDGINRFDGRSFDIFNSSNKNQNKTLTGNNVSDFIQDTLRNTIWLVTSYGGVTGINMNTLTITNRIIDTDFIKLSEKWLRSIAMHKNILWLGSSNGLYAFDLDKQSFIIPQFYSELNISPDSLNVIKSVHDNNGRIWAFCANYGILVIEGSSGMLTKFWSIKDLKGNDKKNQVFFWDACTTPKNEIYVASTIGLLKFDYASNRIIYDPKENSKNEEVFACTSDSVGNIWFSTKNSLHRRNVSGNLFQEFKNINLDKDFKNNTIYEILVDRAGNLWLGQHEGLAFIQKNANPFLSIYRSATSNNTLNHIYSICPINDTLVYTGGEDGLYKIQLNSGNIKHFKNNSSYYLLFKLPDNNILVSGSDGLFVTSNDNLLPADNIYPELDKIKTELFNSAINLTDDKIILGSQLGNGFYLWDRKQKEVLKNSFSKKEILDKTIVNSIFKSYDGNVWMLSESSINAYDFKNEILKKFTITNPLTGRLCSIFFDMCESKDSYWFAAYGTGIVEVDKKLNLKKIISSKNGLSNNGVYKIFCFQDSLIITSSNHGLSVYNVNSNHLSNYFDYNGLHSNSFEQFAGIQFQEKIFVGGMKGLTIVDPRYISRNSNPCSLYFTKILIQTKEKIIDTINTKLFKYIIPNNWLQASISFVGLNYSNPKQVSYKYKIREINTDWITLINQNSVTLIGISPGTYHLQVQAFNEDGVPSEIKELTLIFLPKWYQTWQFNVLIVLIILAIVYGLYRTRINQLKKEEKIRNQVAGDLHDELGSTLNSVKIFANLALLEKENTTHLEKIKESTQSAISGVKDIIWVLDDKRDTLDHLLGRINQFARPICEAAGISYRQQSDGNESYKLGKEEKRNLYMIIKESINNSIKYGECSVIELLIKNNGGKLNISISDDGKGFDKNKIERGYGLRNITHRSKEIEYHAEINSSPGNGTLIYLEKK